MEKSTHNPESSIGIVETVGQLALVCASDTMVKAADVTIVGFQTSGGGRVAVWVRGELSAVKTAVDAARQSLRDLGEMWTLVLASPSQAVMQLADDSRLIGDEVTRRDGAALGFIETIGFVPLAAAVDKMIKAAHVNLVGVARSGGGVLTAMLTGDIAAVRFAVDAGYDAASEVGQALGSGLIARPDRQICEDLVYNRSDIGRPPAIGARTKAIESPMKQK